MEQRGNFILMSRDEFKSWLDKQNVTRDITILQVHHTWSPDYGNFKGDNHFSMMNGMRDSHKKRGFSDIAQQFTTFPDGKIGYSLGRTLNIPPAGIKGGNATGICLEHVGNFNSDGDKITEEHRKTIVHMYACMVKKFKLEVSSKNIRYHGWYTAAGTYLGDYNPDKSAKTCPGDKWWGDGNTLSAAQKNFFPQIKAELNRLNGVPTTTPVTPEPTKPIEKDDDRMTPAEKEAMAKLEKIVQDQATLITSLKTSLENIEKNQSIPVPDWAAKPVYDFKTMEYAPGKFVLDTPNGLSLDAYRTITMMHRALVSKGLIKV